MSKHNKSHTDSKSCIFVGLDVHKNYLQAAVMNEGRLLKEASIPNNIRYIRNFFNDMNDAKIARKKGTVAATSKLWKLCTG